MVKYNKNPKIRDNFRRTSNNKKTTTMTHIFINECMTMIEVIDFGRSTPKTNLRYKEGWQRTATTTTTKTFPWLEAFSPSSSSSSSSSSPSSTTYNKKIKKNGKEKEEEDSVN